MTVPMLVKYEPTGPLGSYVETLWYCEGYASSHETERVLPNGRFQLIINLSEGVRSKVNPVHRVEPPPPPLIIGMKSTFSVIYTATLQSVMGVLFRPGCARPFFPVSAEDFFNKSVPLDLCWGAMANDLRDRLREVHTPAKKFRLLEITLLQRMNPRVEMHAAVSFALEQIARAPHVNRVLEITKEAGLSRRRLSQLFREQVGLTPKLYCRLNRFQGALSQIASGAPVDWADVALAGGYCDQSHFGNEFRQFSGICPSSYLANETVFMNHVGVH